jgi:altronate dehydratase large subunit
MLVNQFVGSALNPNIAGVLLVGLGCETLTGELLKEKIEGSRKPVHDITIQDEGGTANTYEKGVKILAKMRKEADLHKREPFPLSELTLALECGGSDTTSGLAANPALGIAANKLIDAGGRVIFGETQEMIGTQDILAKRAVNKQVADDIYEIIENQMSRLKARGINSRWMSKGNMDGGLTTIEEKSLGSIQKGGTRPIQRVLFNDWDRFDTPDKPGLYIMDGPTFDVASVTHMVAAGAQVVCFTSGRGSTTGHAVAPVIKITGNSSTYEKLEDNIDINAGPIMEGLESINEVGERIFEKIILTASGEETKAEKHGLYEFNMERKNRATENLLGHC